MKDKSLFLIAVIVVIGIFTLGSTSIAFENSVDLKYAPVSIYNNQVNVYNNVNIYGNRTATATNACATATNARATASSATATNANSWKTTLCENKITLFDIENSQVYAGEKLKIDLRFETADVSSVQFGLRNITNKSDVHMIDVLNPVMHDEAYFVLPESINPGTYEVYYILLKSPVNVANYLYDTEDFSKITKNILVTVKERELDSIISVKNEELNDELLNRISSSSKKLEVTVDCSGKSEVSLNLFDAVRKSNSKLILTYNGSTMTFFGDNITDAKNINFTISVKASNAVGQIANKISNAVVIEFPENGNLPGEALVKANVGSSYNDKEVFVYYYNEANDKLEIVAENVKVVNGIATFSIDHNSSFVISTENVYKNEVVPQAEDVSFVNNEKIYLIVIGIAGLLIIILSIIIISSRVKYEKNKKKNNIVKEEPKTEEDINNTNNE